MAGCLMITSWITLHWISGRFSEWNGWIRNNLVFNCIFKTLEGIQSLFFYLPFTQVDCQTLICFLLYQSARERNSLVISQNAIFLFNSRNPLQAHSAKYSIKYQSEIHIAERTCKDKTQKHRASFKGTFAAWNPEAANKPSFPAHNDYEYNNGKS